MDAALPGPRALGDCREAGNDGGRGAGRGRGEMGRRPGASRLVEAGSVGYLSAMEGGYYPEEVRVTGPMGTIVYRPGGIA